MYQIVDDELVEKLKENRSEWLFLEPHSEFKGYWQVGSFEPAYFFDLKEIIGPYRAVSPASLEEFMKTAKEYGYKVAFFEEPTAILDHYQNLNEIPPISLHSPLEGTINGLLPYQVQGFNFLKDLDGGVALMSTGTGKTVVATALLKHFQGEFDIAWFVVKSHNKINTQRILKKMGDLDSVILDGPKKKREKILEEVAKSPGKIVITNYEKFRVDKSEIAPLMENQRVLCIWDEMNTKLKNRGTQIYKSVCECLYTTKPPIVKKNRIRPASLRQYMLSATPIENSPEDFFNTVRLLDPEVFGSVRSFYDSYVSQFSYFNPGMPSQWHDLDKMGMVASHVTFQVDKNDPDIAAQFPEVIEIPYYIDWEPSHRKLYDKVAKQASELDLEEVNILALITVLQMLCDAPSMLRRSADLRKAYEDAVDEWIDEGGKEPDIEGSEIALRIIENLGENELCDDGHTKLETLKEILEEYSDDKILLFSSFNDSLLPILEAKLKEWNISYVRYTGDQKEEDKFKEDPNIQVFLSSDLGSDSLSLEQASIVCHFDLPWKWSTYIQRQNRAHRVVSEHKNVKYLTLLMADSVEDRKQEIITKKQSFHNQVFKGAVADQSVSARMTKEDLRYILLGE